MIGPVRLPKRLKRHEQSVFATSEISQTPGYIQIILKQMCELKYPIKKYIKHYADISKHYPSIKCIPWA